MSTRVLITGGSGFIGTNLVEHYRQRADAVLNLDPRQPAHPQHGTFWRRIDPVDLDALRQLFAEFRPTHLLHFGARTDLHGNSLADYEANVIGVSRIIEAIRTTPTLERAIFASSRMVCDIKHSPRGDEDYSPPNAYGESKMVGELLVRAAGLELPWTIVRPTSIWGPWFDLPYKTFFLAVARGRYFNVAGRTANKSFGFVGNTVFQIDRLLAADSGSVHGRTLYLGDYPPINVGDMAQAIRERLAAPPVRTLPRAALAPVAKVGDVLQRLGWPDFPLTTFRLDNLTAEMVFDLTPLQQLAGNLPYTMEEGIDLTLDWLRARHEV